MSSHDQDWDDDSGHVARIRPYVLTAGRTTPRVSLPMEATLVLEPAARERTWPNPAITRITQVCDRRSVAEVSALVGMPLGVVRVLLGDLVDTGFVAVQATITDRSSKDERRDLIERTLRGLRAI
ncbi:DUF742 domain-containing protein [Nocardioides solisilvae]|uniref:DUF742 domain-containing protein n=1 Tax=Nocardioides solisilvae TaxID=1542435 RepID=UPI000D74120C|nr:DUF742 domain-containing protein [Nocardioides solisilvae]